MAKTKIITVHGCGGSMAEAIDVHWGFTLPARTTEKHAEQIRDALQMALEATSTYDEWFVQYVELDDFDDFDVTQFQANLTPAQIAQINNGNSTLGKGQVPLDFRKIVKHVFEDSKPMPMKPPSAEPVTDDEIAEAFS